MRYLKTIILLWVAILACLRADAQSAANYAISAGGGAGTSGGKTMVFTIGEPVIATIGTNPKFTQGLHQTFISAVVTNVTSTNTTNTFYKAGGVITITVAFSQPVNVTGTPELALNSTGKATYTSGSGTSLLTFTYTVLAGENAALLDYSATGSLTLAGGTITGTGGTPTLALPTPGAAGSLAANKILTVDTQPPVAPLALALAAGSDTGTSTTDNITNVTTPTVTGTAELNSSVTLFDTDGTTSLGTATADATTGAWSITTSTLAQGVHSLTAKATDKAGNIGVASTALSITIDTTAPTLAITSDLALLKAGQTATITFTFSEDPSTSFTWNGTTGSVTVTGGALGAISGTGLTRTATFTPTAGINNGSASITVAAGAYTDIAGNAGGAGTSPVLNYDTQPPVAPSTPVLAAGSDSGTSNSDGITNVTTPVITGTAELGATVKLYDTDGVTLLGTAIADATTGAWSITSTALSAGVHSLTAKATDAAGNVGPASAALSITIDTTAPVLNTIVLADANPSNATTVHYTLTFSEAVAGVDITDFNLSNTGTAAGTVSAATSTDNIVWSVTVNTITGNGTMALNLNASGTGIADIAGNAISGGFTGGPAYTFDHTAPTLTAVNIVSDNANPTYAKVGNTATLTFTASEALQSPVVTIAGHTVAATATGNNWTASYTFVTGDTEGLVPYSITFIDLAGNAGTPVTTGTGSVTFDKTAPTLSAVDISSNNALPILAKVGDKATLTFTSSEALQSPVVTIAGHTVTATATGNNWTASYTFTAGDTEGLVPYSIAFSDLAGNAGTPVTTGTGSVTFDKTVPTLTAVNIVSNNAVPTLARTGNTATLTFTASEVLQTPAVTIAGHAVTPTASGNNWTATYTFVSGDPDGLVAYNISFSDLAGNAGTDVSTGTGSVTLDNNTPTLSAVNIVSDNGVPTLAKVGNTATLTFTSSEALQTPVVTIAGHTVTATATGNNWTASYTFIAGDTEGLVPYSITFSDLAGNAGTPVTTGTGSVTFDKTAPTLSAVNIASDNTVPTLAKPGNTATLTFTSSEALQTPVVTIAGHTVTPTASGNNWTATYTFVTGDPQGLVAYNISFSDLAGNAGTPVSTGTGSVSLDNTAPTLTAVNIVSNNAVPTLAKTGNTATLTFTSSEALQTPTVTIGGHNVTPTASGNNWTATYTFVSGDPDGLVPYNISFSDLAGNAGTPVSTGTGSVTLDNSVPTLTAVNIVSNNAAPTLATTGNTATLSFTSSEALQTPVVTIAGHTVTATAAGNNWTASYTFTAGDTEGLVPYSITFSDLAGNAGTPVTTGTGSVTFDKTAPTLSAVNIVSNNTVPTLATTGNTATLTFTSSEALQTPVVTIAGHTVTPTASGNNWTATYTFAPGDPQGLVAYNISYSDLAGNAGTPVSTGTGSVTLDQSVPTLSAVNIVSNNAVPTLAKSGNTATLTFTSSETLQTPTVTIGGHTVTPTASGNNWTATYTFTPSDPDGLVAYNISFSDLAGNAGTPVSTGTGSVTLDNSVPTLTAVNIGSNNAVPTLATIGNTATLTFTSSEALQTPVVTIAGHTVAATAAGNNWTASYTFTAGDTEGLVPYSITFSDLAGNTGTPVTTGTGSVTFDKTAPAVPTGLAAASGDTQNVLTWNANTETDFAKYRIFFGTSPSPSTLLAEVTGATTFTQTGLTNGTLYYYNIQAVDKAGNQSAVSADVSATPKANQTITFTAIASKTYGDATFALGSANSSANLPVTYTAADPTLVSITGNMATILKAGTTTITASQAGNASFNPAAAVQQSLTVNTAGLTIVNTSRSKVYGDVLGNADFTGSITGIQNGDNITVTRSSTGAAITAATGPYPIVATLVDPNGKLSNYTVNNANGTLTVGQKTVTLTASNLSKNYGDVLVFAGTEFSVTGLINGDAVTSVTLNSAGAAATASVAGSTYNIVASAATGTGVANYNFTYAVGQLTVNPRPLTISANNQSKFLGSVNPPLTASYTGLANGETSVVLTAQPVLTTTAITSSPVGTYDILVSGAAAANYAITYQKGTLTVKSDVPTSISLAAVTLYENAPAGTSAGTLNSTSADPSAVFTYSLVSGTGSTDNALFAITGNNLKTTAPLDYENKAVYSIRVRSTTANNSSLEQVLTVNLTDVNEVPTLAPIASQTICFTSAVQTLPLTGISAGPELNQTTTLSVSSNNAALFQSLTVAGSGSTGTLSYRLRDGAAGTATITVTVKDNGGTANGGVDTFSQSFTLVVNANPVLSITSNKGTDISLGDIVQLTASGGTNYVWTSNSSILSGQNTPVLTVRPRVATTYTVSSTNANGCTQSQSFTLNVLDDMAKIKATNILSPNGDGYNDKWIVDNIDFYPNNEVKIFDKAGRILYNKKGYDNSWDGTLDGHPLNEGTYYYIIDFGPNRQKFKGFITIVRNN
jgi:gliding motility-associated-like protein